MTISSSGSANRAEPESDSCLKEIGAYITKRLLGCGLFPKKSQFFIFAWRELVIAF
jgi:hypothetical protein